MDGLLGIGAAGGSAKANEGAMLQARLDSLRAERDQRAKEKKEETVTPSVVPQPSSPVNTANRAPNPPRRNTKSKRKKNKK